MEIVKLSGLLEEQNEKLNADLAATDLLTRANEAAIERQNKKCRDDIKKRV